MIKSILRYFISVEKYKYARKTVTRQDYDLIKRQLDNNPGYSLAPLKSNTKPGGFLWRRLIVNVFLFGIGVISLTEFSRLIPSYMFTIYLTLYSGFILFFSWYTVVQWLSHFRSLRDMESYFLDIEQGIRKSSEYEEFLDILQESDREGNYDIVSRRKTPLSVFNNCAQLRYLLFIFYGSLGLHSNVTYAQEDLTDFNNRWQAGVIGGGNWFFSDLGGRPGTGGRFVKDWMPGFFTPTVGLQAAHNFNYRTSLHFTLQTGRFSADDSKLGPSDNSGRFSRNLSVMTPVREFSVSGRYTWRKRSNYVLNHFLLHPFSTYVSAGIGVLHFDPRVRWKNNWISLRPLRTEGQGMSEYPDRSPYGSWTFFIPFTLGAQYAISQRSIISIEAVFRKSFSDYLDDVSTSYIDPIYFNRYLSGQHLDAALALHDRSGEIRGGVNRNSPGDIRGLSGNDTWVTWRVGLFFTIGMLTPFY